MNSPVQSVGKATMRGAAWLAAQMIAARVFTLLSQFVLAWLLVPSDFGLVGLAITVTALARTLVSFGIDDVLLQRQKTMPLWQSSAFWATLGMAVAGTAVVVACAPIAANLYHNRSLTGLIVIMAIAMPIGAVSTVSGVTIRAAMGFRFLALYNTFEIAGTQLLTILLAFCHLGAYSFAIPVPLLALVKAVLFWHKAPPRVRWRLRLSQLRYLGRSGFHVFIARLLVEGVAQGDYITLGLLATKSVVGAYFFAFRIAAQPLRLVAGNFMTVLFPAFAQLNADRDRQTGAALAASEMLSYLAMPLCFLQAALVGPLLTIAFGAKWAAAIPLVQALSLGLPFDAVSWVAAALMTARGEFRRKLFITIFTTPIFFICVVVGARVASALGVACGVSFYYMVTGPIYGFFAFNGRGVRFSQIAGLYTWPPMLAGCTIGISFVIAQYVFHEYILHILFIAFVGSLSYIVLLGWLRPRVLSQIHSRISAPILRSVYVRKVAG